MRSVSTLFALMLVFLAAGCSSLEDRAAARLGLPKRGFIADMIFPEGGNAGASIPATTAVNADCATTGCSKGEQFCRVRGYQPDTDGFRRCLVSVGDALGRQVR